MRASLLTKTECRLCESPLWLDSRKSLLWVDIEEKTVFEYCPENKKTTKWKFPYRVSVISEEEEGYIIVGMQGGIARFHFETNTLDWLLDIEKDLPGNRTNDGKCDARGRLWVGTMNNDCAPGQGSLYVVDPALTLRKMLANLTISNGITWSLDNKVLYHIDSFEKSVDAYFFDLAKGDIRFMKKIIHIPHELGMPDGMTIDENGLLWIAQWDGFCVCCWNPLTGRLVSRIEMPVPKVSSCVFGGKNLDQLFITTASVGLSREELERYPDSGSIYMATPGVRGLKSHRFGSINHDR